MYIDTQTTWPMCHMLLLHVLSILEVEDTRGVCSDQSSIKIKDWHDSTPLCDPNDDLGSSYTVTRNPKRNIPINFLKTCGRWRIIVWTIRFQFIGIGSLNSEWDCWKLQNMEFSQCFSIVSLDKHFRRNFLLISQPLRTCNHTTSFLYGDLFFWLTRCSFTHEYHVFFARPRICIRMCQLLCQSCDLVFGLTFTTLPTDSESCISCSCSPSPPTAVTTRCF